jgi:hypothetical protein
MVHAFESNKAETRTMLPGIEALRPPPAVRSHRGGYAGMVSQASALRGIDEQIAKAEKAVAGKTPVKRNRFVQLFGGTLEARSGTARRPS